METTPLSSLITDMNQWQAIANIAELYKVIALDKAIQTFKRQTVFPWMIKKTTLRVFGNVLEYPVASDHDEMFYFEKQNINQYADTARFFSTSIQQFFEDVNSSRNLLTEIWKDGTKSIGLNLKDGSLLSQNLSTAEIASEYSVADDADAVTLDNVTYKTGNGSMRITVNETVADLATITNTVSPFSDADYRQKYQFRWIYLNSVPTSIEMQLKTDNSNYLKTVVTTQFSGAALKASDWNLIAQDLNLATEVGTFDSANITGETIIINGVATGSYWLDSSDLRQWTLLDYWYYSKFVIGVNGATVGSKTRFYDSSAGTYETSDFLIGDQEWVDVIECEAMMDLVADVENSHIFSRISKKREQAWAAFNKKYPSMVPLITTQKYRFRTDFNSL